MDWKSKTFLIGAVIGLLAGLAGAYMVISRAEREKTVPKVTSADGVKIGLGVLGVLRLVSDIAEREK